MSNKFKDIGLKYHTYCFFDDIINAKNSDPIKTKIGEKSYKSFFCCQIGYGTIKDLKCLKINSVNPLYLLMNKANKHFQEINKNKYLTLVPTNENQEIVKAI